MKSAFEELKESRDRFFSQFSNGRALENTQENYTEIIDQYFRKSLEESEAGQGLFREKKPFTFVAVGGYGRKELCLQSDIDIIILFGSKIPQRAKVLADEVLFPLWDLGLDLGYAIRNIKDCLALSKDDFEVLTSMMDARFLCGDSPLYLSLMESLQNKVISKKAALFSRWLKEEDEIRMEQFGAASHLLEPHLKEGIGGLRDYHHMLWLAKAYFNLRIPRDLEYLGKLSQNEYNELHESLRFIWLVRDHLHLLSGRKNDRLSFEYQEKIAEKLEFDDHEDTLAVEQFLGKLHSCMASLNSLHRSFIHTHLPKKRLNKEDFLRVVVSNGLYVYQKELYFDSAVLIPQNPLLLIEIFEKCSFLGCKLSIEARRLGREFLDLIDDAFRRSEETVQCFLSIMNNEHTFGSLEEMFETGFLGAFIPEFSKIKDRVQFDAYHMFTVGRHSLEAVRNLKGLKNEKDILLFDILSDLSNPEPLLLAALFHDLGKVGKDHSRRGVEIVRGIARRFGYDKKCTKDLLFLVENHLLLSETATRRDLNDEKVVVLCARTIKNAERLKMLYLLTWADSKATGPRAWNSWIANLVQELFFKILHILERKELATPHAAKKVNKTRSEVRRLAEGLIGPQALENFFDMMSPRYILSTGSNDIVHHLSLVQQFSEQLKHEESSAFVLDAKEQIPDGYWEVTFLAKDRPGLFSDLAGVLALKNLNILSANIYTWRDGTAIDIFRVSSPLDPIHPDETWENVRRDLDNIFKGKLSLAYRLGRKATPSILSERKKPSRPPKVLVDNESSDFFTLIEVFADDQVGLLYKITRTLFELRLDIRIAKIATKVDQIADVFYVRDLEGQKVEDEDRLKEVKEALHYQLIE